MKKIKNSNQKPAKVHLEIQGHRKNPYGILRSSYREGKSIKHKTYGRLTGLDINQLKLLRAALQGDVIAKGSKEALKILASKEYGASVTAIKMAKAEGLDEAIYSKPEDQWVKDSLAMIAGRLIYQGSKLTLSHNWQNTCLWELCGITGPVDVDKHCYLAMDKLYKRKNAIEKKLAKKHLREGQLILYDITSSYMEGEYVDSEIVKYGYNRDQKKGHAQIVIGLICNDKGCPVGVEIFPGNTQDATTVMGKIKEIKEKYEIQDVIFVGDRGMTTHSKIDEIRKEGAKVITALNHQQIKELLKQDIIQLGLFDDNNIVEVNDPENPEIRYCLCRNPNTAKRETETRIRLLTKTKEELKKIQQSKRKGSDDKLGARVGKVLTKHKMGKFIEWEVKNKEFSFSIKNDLFNKEESLDGCYIITTDVAKEKLNTNDVVKAYKNLAFVEIAFRNLKTAQLEIRPVYHKYDDRIKCHVFLCMLAYYLQWHMQQRLVPIFENDGKGKNRRWTFKSIIDCLKGIRQNRVSLNNIEFDQMTELTVDQNEIINLLNIRL